jgi:hypothetical protein
MSVEGADVTEDAQPDTVAAEPEHDSGTQVDGTTILGPAGHLAWSEVGEDEQQPRQRRWGNKLRWAAAVVLLCCALAAVLVLSGVFYTKTRPGPPSAAPPSAAPTPTSAPVTSVGAVPEQDRDATYIRLLDKSAGWDHKEHYYTTQEGAIRFGRNVCAAMRGGAPQTLAEQALARTRPDLTAQQRMVIVGLAISIYCPELIGK